MESFLSGAYSSVHTRVGFNSKVFVTPTEYFLIQKGDILKKIKKGRGKKDLMKGLMDLWWKDEGMHGQKLNYKLRLQDEEKLSKKRVFSKLFKLDENN